MTDLRTVMERLVPPARVENEDELRVILQQYAAADCTEKQARQTKDALKKRIEQLVSAPRTEIGGWEISLVEPGETTSWDGPALVAIVSALQALPEYAPLCESIMACRQKGERKGYTRLERVRQPKGAAGCNRPADGSGARGLASCAHGAPCTAPGSSARARAIRT